MSAHAAGRPENTLGYAFPRLRVVPDPARALTIESAVTPEAIGVLQFVVISLLRPTGATMGVMDDLRIAVDELLAPLVATRCTMRVQAGLDGRAVVVVVLADRPVDIRPDAFVRSLVDDIGVTRVAGGVELRLRRTW